MSKYIDADALKRWIQTECNPYGAPTLDYVSSVKIMKHIDKMPAVDVELMGRWISVDERLPENANNHDAFRPKYQIYTSFGITEGWYGWSGNTSGWYALIWFMDGRYKEWLIDLEWGDIPKIAFIPNGGEVKVYAWREFPEPPKMDGGSECDNGGA